MHYVFVLPSIKSNAYLTGEVQQIVLVMKNGEFSACWTYLITSCFSVVSFLNKIALDIVRNTSYL